MWSILRSVGLALLVANLRRRIRNLVTRGILGGAGAVVLIIAVSFLLVAVHLTLSVLLNPIASAAIIGGVLLGIAFLLFFLASRPMREQAREVEDPIGQLSSTVREGASRFSDALGPEGSPLRSPILQAAGLALIAGFFLGRRGRHREDD
jgi:hypothetical protein